jgi:hypothetical protein
MGHMNKVFAIAVLILLPVSVLAMSPLSDEDLSSINGQAGVSIMPNITMNIHIDVLAWGDSDGLGSDNIWGVKTSGGYVGVKNLTLTNLYIGPRTGPYTGMWPITIDVGNGVVRTADEAYTRLDLEYLQNPLRLPNLKWR